MPIIIPEQITLQSDELGDGCSTFNIYQAPTASNPDLITTITAAQLEEGFALSGSNIHNAYYLECVDTNSVIRSSTTLLNCEGGVALDDVVCPEPVTFSGGIVFPATYTVDLGLETGSVSLEFEAYQVPDKFILNWSGSTVINTGYRGSTYYTSNLNTALAAQNAQPESITSPGNGTVSFYKSTPLPNIAYIQVYAPMEGTAWNLTVNCPDGVSEAAEEDEVIGTCEAPPTHGGACLTGTTSVTEFDDWPQVYNNVPFTLNQGSTAVVTPLVSVRAGYITPSASAVLTDEFDNIIQTFKIFQDQDETEPRYYPQNYTLTQSGNYKLAAYSFPIEDGNGCVSLYVSGCSSISNYQITANASKYGTSSGNIFTGLQIIIPGTGTSVQIAARELVEYLSGRSVSMGYAYPFSNDTISYGFTIEDEDIPEEVGDISVSAASSISYNVAGTETIVQMNSISGTGTLNTIQTGVTPLVFQRKN